MPYLMVALGGALGALARYSLGGWLQQLIGGEFPYGTLAVNVVGSFLIAVVLQLSLERFLLSPEARLLLATGFCGSLTTFSTFSYETLRLMQEQQWTAAGANVALNVVLCLAAVYAGLVAGRLL